MREPPVIAAIKAAGSVAELARLLEIEPQAVSQWTKVPVGRLLQVEKVTGIPRAELRPDLFGGIPSIQQAQAAPAEAQPAPQAA